MPGPIDQLCLKCGMCCNGVLFADVRRERGDKSPLFTKYGARVPQPCPAFNPSNCKCVIYLERPARCRQFECRQLLNVRAGKQTVVGALERIRQARRLAAKAGRLLAELNFPDVSLPLNERFRRCQQAAEQGQWTTAQLGSLARLQTAMHELSVVLAADFY